MTRTERLVWGAVGHLAADWLLQNDWMARYKMRRRLPREEVRASTNPARVGKIVDASPWWDRHPAAYVHACIHAGVQVPVFGWRRALGIGVAHMLIDTRWPLMWWRGFFHQLGPEGRVVRASYPEDTGTAAEAGQRVPLYDMGTEVAIWSDQVAHLLVLAAATLTERP